MPIPVACPACQAKFRVADELAGRKLKCPKCRAPVTASDAAPPTPAVQSTKPATAPQRAAASPLAKPTGAPSRAATSTAPAGKQTRVDAPTMAIDFACPGCGQRLRAPSTHAGKPARCHNCQQTVLIPLTTTNSSAVKASTKPAAPPVRQKVAAPQKGGSLDNLLGPDLDALDQGDGFFDQALPAAATSTVVLHNTTAAASAAPKKKKRAARQFSLPRFSLAVPGVVAGVLGFFAVVGAMVWGMYGMGIIEPADANDPPTVPHGFLFRAVYETKEGEITNRCAFAVEAPGYSQTVLLTALRTFTTQGEFRRQISTEELPLEFRSAKLTAEFGLGHQATADAVIPLPTATSANIRQVPMFGGKPEGNGPGAGDVAALWGPPVGQIPAIRVARQEPQLAETLWLHAHMADAIEPAIRWHRCTAVLMSEDYLVYALHAEIPNLRHTEGSPLCNKAGEVVAIHVADLTGEDGRATGLATPLRRFAPALQEALKQHAPPDSAAPANNAPPAAEVAPPAAEGAPAGMPVSVE